MAPSLYFPDAKTRGYGCSILYVTVNKLEHPKGGEGCSPLEVKKGMGPLWLNLWQRQLGEAGHYGSGGEHSQVKSLKTQPQWPANASCVWKSPLHSLQQQ